MEQYTIKSVAFGGFDKEDVARYIEQISQETGKLREERDALREQAESAAQEVEALREQVQQLTAAKAQLETEVQRLASAEEENADLRSQLESAGIGEKPVIFVTHSMGGLIVKEMLVEDSKWGAVRVREV